MDHTGRIFCIVADVTLDQSRTATVLDVFDLERLLDESHLTISMKAEKRIELASSMRSVFNTHVPVRSCVSADAGLCVTCVNDRGTKWQHTKGQYFPVG